jgi:aspartyl-tRNA(Asn)/glutamyl-tRNA(Gln) amidotransferase subunit A
MSEVREAAERALQRAAATEHLHAFLHLDAAHVRAQAEALSRRAASRGSLFGLTVALKDALCTFDMPTTAGSRYLEGYRPPYDATVVERLRRADAVLIGKTNLDEFSMGSSTEHSAFGPTRNPWDTTRVPGGSSGGSAVAVAAGVVDAALGSDTGGSVRQPASFCGVYGLKPTYGSVSRYGLVAFASSLDQVGVFARDPAVLARVFATIAGRDPRDATSQEAPLLDAEGSAAATSQGRLGGLRVMMLGGALRDEVDAEIAQRWDEAAQRFVELDASLSHGALTHLGLALPAYYVISSAEASSNLARYDGLRFGRRGASGPTLRDVIVRSRTEGLGREVQRRIMLGTFALSEGYVDAYYRRALDAREVLRRELLALLERADVLLLPTSPTSAFRFGARPSPRAMYAADVCTVPASLAGLPAISVPCGTDSAGLPIGMQLIGPPWSETRLIELARLLATGFPSVQDRNTGEVFAAPITLRQDHP